MESVLNWSVVISLIGVLVALTNIITQVLPVRVRGPKALLDELTEENIQVVADLKGITPTAGQYYTVPAEVYLHNVGTATDVGVVNPKGYTVVVSLTREE